MCWKQDVNVNVATRYIERLIMHVKNVTDICSFPTFFRALHASFNAILTSDQCTPF